MQEHLSGKRGAKYLRGRTPFTLEFEAPIGDRALAQRVEYRVKQLDRRAKLDLIAGRRALPGLDEQDA